MVLKPTQTEFPNMYIFRKQLGCRFWKFGMHAHNTVVPSILFITLCSTLVNHILIDRALPFFFGDCGARCYIFRVIIGDFRNQFEQCFHKIRSHSIHIYFSSLWRTREWKSRKWCKWTEGKGVSLHIFMRDVSVEGSGILRRVEYLLKFTLRCCDRKFLHIDE